MNLLVKKSDRVEVDVYVYDNDGKIEATSDSTEVPNDAKAEVYKFWFRKPNHQDSTTIFQSSQIIAPDASVIVDSAKFQQKVLSNLLVDWNLRDGDDKKIECNQTSIMSLEPTVARAACAGALGKIRL